MEAYRPFYDLPPLAGLADFSAAAKPGLSVEECVRRLKRCHYAFRRLHEIFLSRLAAEPVYELKMAFSLHAYYCAEHATAIRSRIGEMREPPLGLEITPDTALAAYFDSILASPSTAELLSGLYESAVPALIASLERHRTETNPLADAPTVRLIKFALIELQEMLAYGAAAAARFCASSSDLAEARAYWPAALAAAGDLDGALPSAERPPSRRTPAAPFTYDPVPRRDHRFPDPYNMGVNAEAFLYDASIPPEPKVLMMYYKRLREIDVPEVMSSIIIETRDKPWGYYRDMTRQLWDEARHAMMGEVGFVSLGIEWPRHVMVNFTWSLGLNTQLTARERHGVLYFIEQGLMPKTGKRFEWETARAAHEDLSTLFQDYDWADEVLHARIGRDWYVSSFENPKEAVEWGDQCWSKVVLGWRQWRDQGLTEHRNWWPDVYSEFCAQRGLVTDPVITAFDTTYEAQRADLKVLSASA